MTMPEAGAMGFGLVIGWFLYFVNRYRKSEASFTDITTILGAVGGGAVTALFGQGSDRLFGAYGVGLAIGFFSYFLVLVILVGMSNNFGADYFLDGRRKILGDRETIPDGAAQPVYNFDEAPAPDTGMMEAAVTAGVRAGLAARDAK